MCLVTKLSFGGASQRRLDTAGGRHSTWQNPRSQCSTEPVAPGSAVSRERPVVVIEERTGQVCRSLSGAVDGSFVASSANRSTAFARNAAASRAMAASPVCSMRGTRRSNAPISSASSRARSYGPVTMGACCSTSPAGERRSRSRRNCRNASTCSRQGSLPSSK